ncbi:MAG: lysophospholipase [Clostridia bacterium]|nr:lysophospholipase [Clostridia bacterium]
MKKLALTKKDAIYLSIIAVLVIVALVVGLVLGIEPKKDAGALFQEYYDNKCASYSVQNANLSKGQIVFVGDSITDLCPLDDYYLDLPLASYNRGIGGDTTKGVLNRLKLSVYDLEPSKMVLLIGINDLLGGGRDVDSTAKDYAKIIDEVQENLPNTEIYCISIIPVNRTLEQAGFNVDECRAKIMSLNDKIVSISQEKGVEYVNIYDALLDQNGLLDARYTDDGLHLNANGFAVWSGILKPYLA